MLALDAHHNTVGTHEVLDGITLLKELRVRGHIELDINAALGQFVFNSLAYLLGGTYRYSRLRDDNHIILQVLTDGLSHLKNVLQVGRAVLVGRCSNGRKNYLNIVEHRSQIGSELQSARGHILFHEFVEPRLIDGYFAILQTFYLLSIYIDTRHVGTCISKTRS